MTLINRSVADRDIATDQDCYPGGVERTIGTAGATAHISSMALPRTLIDPKLIYLEPAVRDYACGRDVLTRFPNAELVEVA